MQWASSIWRESPVFTDGFQNLKKSGWTPTIFSDVEKSIHRSLSSLCPGIANVASGSLSSFPGCASLLAACLWVPIRIGTGARLFRVMLTQVRKGQVTVCWFARFVATWDCPGDLRRATLCVLRAVPHRNTPGDENISKNVRGQRLEDMPGRRLIFFSSLWHYFSSFFLSFFLFFPPSLLSSPSLHLGELCYCERTYIFSSDRLFVFVYGNTGETQFWEGYISELKRRCCNIGYVYFSRMWQRWEGWGDYYMWEIWVSIGTSWDKDFHYNVSRGLSGPCSRLPTFWGLLFVKLLSWGLRLIAKPPEIHQGCGRPFR
jgi:hypothetical protein